MIIIDGKSYSLKDCFALYTTSCKKCKKNIILNKSVNKSI